MHESDPGYTAEPFRSLVADFPGTDVYPPDDFRTEWGPIFHRGRLDGSAKVLAIGQDPGQHENVARRILVGEAGQRVQGFLRRLGITRSYVMINAFLYSVFGSGGSAHHHDELLVDYRSRWLDALLLGTDVRAVVAFGSFADEAFEAWTESRSPNPAPAFKHLLHPTYPESASSSGQITKPEAMARLLTEWNVGLEEVRPAIVDPDVEGDPTPYGSDFRDQDLAPIPEADLPPGVPSWMRGLDPWALRVGETEQLKRSTIVITVPEADRIWPPLD